MRKLQELKSKFPSLVFGRYLFAEGRIIILDQEIPQEIQSKLSSLKTKDGKETLLMKTQEIAADLDALLKQGLSEIINIRDTLFVFPGNGAKKVRELSKIHIGYLQTEVFAKRFWKPGNEPIVTVGTITPPVGTPKRKIKTIIVLDDVISSGQTFFKLYEKNFDRFKTSCTWFGGCWFAQVPRMERTISGITGYQKIITAIVVEGPQGKRVPLNSLSTLVLESEIAKSYAQRHFQDPVEFLEIIQKLSRR